MRGALLTKESSTSFAEVHRVLVSEPTHMEGEDEDQEEEVVDGRDCEESKSGESKRIKTTTTQCAWGMDEMTCAIHLESMSCAILL